MYDLNGNQNIEINEYIETVIEPLEKTLESLEDIY